MPPNSIPPNSTLSDSVPPRATSRGAGPAAQFAPGTFAPDPRAAAPLRRITATAGLELRMTLRNGEQLLLALIIPLLALIGGTLIGVIDLPEPRVDAVVPGVLVLAVLSSAFTSQAITTGFDRRYGVLKRFAAAGIGRSQLIAGKCAATLAVIAGQFVVLGGAALLLGWRPEGSPLWVLAITLLGAAAFIGIALLLGGTLRAEAVLAVANLLWLVFVLVGGVIVPLDQAPEMLRTIGELTPPGAMSQALRAVLQDGAAPPAVSLLVLVGWIVVGWAATVRWFRWQ
jgi:ABC-2 type transport system permease protein